MSDDYLWDRTGEGDPDIEQLEYVLGDLRWSGRQADLHSIPSGGRRYGTKFWAMVAAAAIVLAAGTTFVVQRMHSLQVTSPWRVSMAGRAPGAVRSGEVIETGLTRATLRSEFVGELDIFPNSRLRVLPSPEDQPKLALDVGTIHALIWAPPARFVVDTPAARTVDLGCQYTLSVANDGKGFLTVQTGWVAFQWKKIESFIPEGAACSTRVGYGPGTPYFLDAPAALTKSLVEFDLTGSRQALKAVLEAARPHDALTVWHLLERTHGEEKAAVLSRFNELVDLPSSVSRDGILRGEATSMDAAWNALRLGDTSWWRKWKRYW